MLTRKAMAAASNSLPMVTLRNLKSGSSEKGVQSNTSAKSTWRWDQAVPSPTAHRVRTSRSVDGPRL